jgi:SAM-dependent methyltransferase
VTTVTTASELPLPMADMPKRELLALFRSERTDPIPFYERLAELMVESLPWPVTGARVLDVGCGPGHYGRALAAAGAQVASVDLSASEFALAGGPPIAPFVGDGGRLPIVTAGLDGLVCSNMIEHTPTPDAVIGEMARVVRPGGWIWLSFTNWLSPYGGHEFSPWHYLGGRNAIRIRTRRGGYQKNIPGDGLYPLSIRQVRRMVELHPDLALVDLRPRYYPTQRWIPKVPLVGEVLTWNAELLIARR